MIINGQRLYKLKRGFPILTMHGMGWTISQLIAHGYLSTTRPSRNQKEGRYAGVRNGRHVRSSSWRWINQRVAPLQTTVCDNCLGHGGFYAGWQPDNYWWEDCGTCSGEGMY